MTAPTLVGVKGRQVLQVIVKVQQVPRPVLKQLQVLQATVVDPQATVVDPQAIVKDPQAIVKDPQAIVKDPQAIVKDPQVIVKDPQAIVKDPQVIVKVQQVPRPVLKQLQVLQAMVVHPQILILSLAEKQVK